MVPSSVRAPDALFASARSRILVVEDELLIRMVVSDELREVGYDVVEACDADEALIVLESSVRVDIVISDVRMPGSMDGLGLLAAIKATYPAIPVIITSGHLEPRLAIQDGATEFLAKPFVLSAVVAAVKRELGTT
jgi:DNA-binding NtrC family response regulator